MSEQPFFDHPILNAPSAYPARHNKPTGSTSRINFRSARTAKRFGCGAFGELNGNNVVLDGLQPQDVLPNNCRAAHESAIEKREDVE